MKNIPPWHPFVTRALVVGLSLTSLVRVTAASAPVNVSGIYPHLTMYNQEGECGTGAVVPWAGRLWVVTYAPHSPKGSSDKLYEITPTLEQIIRPESVGGTPANRMIHRESNQLNIGPYFIDAHRKIRTLPPQILPGRLTGTARHLTDPNGKLYIATMEEGLYSVDVRTLEVVEHIKDGNAQAAVGQGVHSTLPGYHGKGLYSGQGRLFYANNGEHSESARRDPEVPSGALAFWNGEGDWQLIRRNQFTEITGPGGIEGNAQPATDPIWAMGWDSRSLLLMLLDQDVWHTYRLPKGSHTYDGAHGWNTEWPRIRDIGEEDLLATMHGTFWRFPRSFTKAHSAGITPRSNYLKVIGDFALWGDRIVLGCDDSAKKEFLNTRPFKSAEGAPLQSNSNLWFIEPEQLDRMGPVIGRGSVWLREDVSAGQPSDPYLFSGYDHRMLTIIHHTGHPVEFTLEVDRQGDGTWAPGKTFRVETSCIHIFAAEDRGAWIRIRAQTDAKKVTAHFHYRNRDARAHANDPTFAPVCPAGVPPISSGLIRGCGQVLGLVRDEACYTLNHKLVWTRDPAAAHKKHVMASQPPNIGVTVDAASVIVTEDGRTFRIPRHDAYKDHHGRLCREVATERDLFNCHGTFYELPARNAQGFAKIRPIATHHLMVDDYASHFGLLFITGLAAHHHPRVFTSTDGQAAVWAGVIDDLWKLGKPRGQGGPWKDTPVQANIPSDPYLMTGYDKKSVSLMARDATDITLEIDIDGTGLWVPVETFKLQPGIPRTHTFPEGFSAYWIRAISSAPTTATVDFVYE